MWLRTGVGGEMRMVQLLLVALPVVLLLVALPVVLPVVLLLVLSVIKMSKMSKIKIHMSHLGWCGLWRTEMYVWRKELQYRKNFPMQTQDGSCGSCKKPDKRFNVWSRIKGSCRGSLKKQKLDAQLLAFDSARLVAGCTTLEMRSRS